MRNAPVIKLDDSEVSAIKLKWPPQAFIREFPLFYSGQVPNLAFLLTEGQIIIRHESKGDYVLKPPSLIGFKQLLKNIPSQSMAIICPNSKACLIDKATLVELLRTKSESAEVFQKFIA